MKDASVRVQLALFLFRLLDQDQVIIWRKVRDYGQTDLFGG